MKNKTSKSSIILHLILSIILIYAAIISTDKYITARLMLVTASIIYFGIFFKSLYTLKKAK